MKLKELRENNHMSQTEFAKIMNIKRVTYNKYELGTNEPNLDILKQIANYYNVSLDYLCDRQWDNKAYIEVWKLSDEQKANLYIIEKLSQKNNLRANGYLIGLLQEQQTSEV